MTGALAELVPVATASSRQPYAEAHMEPAIIPMGFALVGGLTGASAAVFPAELIDWTSANVIALVRPDIGSRATIVGVDALVVTPPAALLRRRLDEIKSRSGLTWRQIADAMRVDARALHLWRSGGGISAAHDERLQELAALVDSLDDGNPEGVRELLLEAPVAGSLLERLRAGASPRELQVEAPWRRQALQDLERNIDEWQNDGVLDEQFVFLLYLEPNDVEAFATEARRVLGSRETIRREWEALLDARFALMQQPVSVEVEAEDDADEPEGDYGIPPLFKPADVGVELGVGAIASRRPLNDRW